MNSLLGLEPMLDSGELIKLLVRLVINLSFVFIIVRWIYFRLYKDREFVFTYYLLNLITFSLCFLLRKVPAEMGFALAIFAVFGILRYRTEQVRIRDLTYLFIVIGIGVINAIANKSVDLWELLIVNGITVGMTALIELSPFSAREASTHLLYDNLDLLKPGRDKELLEDIQRRTGLETIRVEIMNFDLLRDAVNLKVYHRLK